MLTEFKDSFSLCSQATFDHNRRNRCNFLADEIFNEIAASAQINRPFAESGRKVVNCGKKRVPKNKSYVTGEILCLSD